MFEAEFWFEFDTFLISGDFCNIEVCSNGFSEISISKDSFCFLEDEFFFLDELKELNKVGCFLRFSGFCNPVRQL